MKKWENEAISFRSLAARDDQCPGYLTGAYISHELLAELLEGALEITGPAAHWERDSLQPWHCPSGTGKAAWTNLCHSEILSCTIS